MKTGIHGANVFLTGTGVIIITSLLAFGLAEHKKSSKIQLSDFEAYMIDDVAFITWTTSSEVKNKEVRLEKSSNGKDFNTVQTFRLNGAGSMYTYVDSKPNFGVSYYRIRHSNKNDDITPLINHDGPVDFEVIPDAGLIQLRANLGKEETYLLSLSDAAGKHYLIQSVTFDRNRPITIDTRELKLKSQEYIVKLHSPGWAIDKRVVL